MKDLIIFAVLLFFLFMLMTKSDDKYSYNKYGYRKYGYNKDKKENVGGASGNSGLNDSDNMDDDDENKLFNMIDDSGDGMIDKTEFDNFMKLPHTHDNYVDKNEFNTHDHDEQSDDDVTGADAGVTGDDAGVTGADAGVVAVAAVDKEDEVVGEAEEDKEQTGGFNDIMGYDMDDNYNYL